MDEPLKGTETSMVVEKDKKKIKKDKKEYLGIKELKKRNVKINKEAKVKNNSTFKKNNTKKKDIHITLLSCKNLDYLKTQNYFNSHYLKDFKTGLASIQTLCNKVSKYEQEKCVAILLQNSEYKNIFQSLVVNSVNKQCQNNQCKSELLEKIETLNNKLLQLSHQIFSYKSNSITSTSKTEKFLTSCAVTLLCQGKVNCEQACLSCNIDNDNSTDLEETIVSKSDDLITKYLTVSSSKDSNYSLYLDATKVFTKCINDACS